MMNNDIINREWIVQKAFLLYESVLQYSRRVEEYCRLLGLDWKRYNFNKEYFRQKMQEARLKKKEKIEAVKKMLENSKSEPIEFNDRLDLDQIDGLTVALNEMVSLPLPIEILEQFKNYKEFNMSEYKQHIMKVLLTDINIKFNEIPPICENKRLDRIFRFITIIYMLNDREIHILQNEPNNFHIEINSDHRLYAIA